MLRRESQDLLDDIWSRKDDGVVIEDPSFPLQDAFVQDKAQFLAAICTRRAGKTNALALRFIRTMKEYPSSLCRYIALTHSSAKDIMWPVLQEMDERFKLGATFTESNLTMTLPNQAKLRLVGADTKSFIRKLKGAKSPAVAIDEAQDFGAHLESLIDDVLTPTIADYSNSWIALTGTPGPIPRGTFYDVTNGGSGDYSVHRWSLFDNPYLPNAHEFVQKLKARKKWTDDNPTYLREYQGRWVLDLDSLLVRYTDALNHFDSLPTAEWIYIMGIDIGFHDADAICILAWNEKSKKIYLVEEDIQSGQDITSLSNRIKRLDAKYKVSKMVIDTGGLGKKIAEELNRRQQIPVVAADKSRKFENAAFLNDWLRMGNFKAKRDSRFAHDSALVQIDYDATTPDRLVLKKGFHSDIIDSVLYAFMASPAFTYEKPKDAPKRGTKEWADQEANEMEEAAMEHFSKDNNERKWWG